MATVEEALTFSARLRMGLADLPRRRLQQVVDLILGLLELDTVAHRLVGTLSRGACAQRRSGEGLRRAAALAGARI
jgi:ABC-type multidrug transport system ATPase subunit